MSSDNSVLHYLKSPSHDFEFISSLKQVEITTAEATNDVKQICAKIEKKRKRIQQPKREDPVVGLLKNLKDRIYRREKEDKIQYMEARLDIKLETRPDLKKVMEKTKAIESDYKEACNNAANSNSNTATVQAIEKQYKKELENVVNELQDLNKGRKGSKKPKINPKNLQTCFANNEFPRIVSGETAGVTTVLKDQGSLGTREQLQATFINLQRELNANENNIVDVSEYMGLKEALEKTPNGETPAYLKLIAIRIQEARGEATKFSHYGTQVMVSAAIKEMEDQPLETLKWPTLKKWGATFNMAKQQGFQVKFAAKLLEKNLYAYVAHSFME